MKEERRYLLHIAESIRRIQEDIAGGRAVFETSHTIQDAVLHNLQLIAESTKRLSDATKAAHSEIDWRAITGLRNFLVHDYLSVDLEVVWQIVVRDVPLLKTTVAAILAAVDAPS